MGNMSYGEETRARTATLVLSEEREGVGVRMRVILGLIVLVAMIGSACASREPAPVSEDSTPATPASAQADSVPHDADTTQSYIDPRQLMAVALRETFSGDAFAIQSMAATNDPSYIPVLIELLRYTGFDGSVRLSINSTLDQLAGHPQDEIPFEFRDWSWWVGWLGKHTEVQPPVGYDAWIGQLYSSLIDPRIGAFFYDGVKSRIRLEEIVWGGVPRDGIPDLINPSVVSAAEATYLEPSDRVFGVSLGGQHRAYPLRILNAHEMANDVVGGVPFALAY